MELKDSVDAFHRCGHVSNKLLRATDAVTNHVVAEPGDEKAGLPARTIIAASHAELRIASPIATLIGATVC